MIIDSLNKVCAAQAFTAAAVSLSSIDLGAVPSNAVPAGGQARQIGTGEPMAFVFTINVASSDTTTLFEIISTTDAALTTSIVVHATMTLLNAQTTLGSLFALPLPPNTPTQRFLGVRITPTGGAATITVSAFLEPMSMINEAIVYYPKTYVV